MNFLQQNCRFGFYTQGKAALCKSFKCGDNDLDDFFTKDAFLQSEELLCKNYCFYLVDDPAQLVAVFTLSNDSIKKIPGSRKRKIEGLITWLPMLKIKGPKMLKKFIIPFSIAALLVACGSDSNSSSATDDSSPNNKGSGSCPKDGSGDDTSCSFKKECDTWKYSEQFMGIRDIYIWQDETTVKHEIWMNDYHMDQKDEVLTDQNRDDLYKEAMEDCEYHLNSSK